MGLIGNILIGISLLIIGWNFANVGMIPYTEWVPDFQITLEQTFNPDQTPQNITEEPISEPNELGQYNLALELEDRVDLWTWWGACASRGGDPIHEADEVACQGATFDQAVCSTDEALIVENQCVNVYDAQWNCDNSTQYIGCYYS